MLVAALILLAALTAAAFAFAAIRLAALSAQPQFQQLPLLMRLSSATLLMISGTILLAAALAAGNNLGQTFTASLSHPPPAAVSTLIKWLEWTDPFLLAAGIPGFLIGAYLSDVLAQ